LASNNTNTFDLTLKDYTKKPIHICLIAIFGSKWLVWTLLHPKLSTNMSTTNFGEEKWNPL